MTTNDSPTDSELRNLAFKRMIKETSWPNPLGFTPKSFVYHFSKALSEDKLSFSGWQLWECYQKHLRGSI